MTRDELKKVVFEVIREISPEADPSTLDPTKRIREQLALDSMDFLDIILELRKRYKIQIPEKDYMQLATLNGCLDYLEPKLKDVPSSQ